MVSDNDLSGLLAVLHAAPLDERKWHSFLMQLCAAAEASHAALVGQDALPIQHSLHAFAALDSDPEPQRLYNQYYGAFDPFREPFLRERPSGLVIADSLLDRDYFKQTLFYNELLRPHNMEHAVMLSVTDPHTLEVITLWRSERQGPLQQSSLDLLELLVPHVQSAMRLRRKLRTAKHHAAAASTSILDRIAIAVLLLDVNGAVVLANAEAEQILRQQDGLVVQQYRLEAATPQTQQALDRILATVGGIAPQGGGFMVVERPSGKAPLQVLASPVQLPAAAPDAPWHVLLAITDPEAHPLSSFSTLNALYGFTRAEAAVASELLRGLSPEEIAQERQVSLGTVRTQLKSMLAKTGTRRQSALLRALTMTPKLRDHGLHSAGPHEAY